MRASRCGVVLLSTLLMLSILACLVALVLATTLSNTLVMRRLAMVHQEQLDRQSLHALLRPLVLEAMIDVENPSYLALDGRPERFVINGRAYAISAQDLSGLIDIYIAPPDLAATLLPPELHGLKARVDAMPERGATLAQTLALAGLSAAERAQVLRLVRQGAARPALNGHTLAAGYEVSPDDLDPRWLTYDQPAEVWLWIDRTK
jgi:hypothetical protein